MTPEALHTSTSNRWFTPSDIIDRCKRVMGEIDLDPASEEKANKIVGATKYYTEEDDGLSGRNRFYGRVFLNPPGDKSGKFPKLFWEKLVMSYMKSEVTEAFYLLFSLNQLQTLQCSNHPPMEYPFCVFDKRQKFIHPDTMTPGNQPSQPSGIVYLPRTWVNSNNEEIAAPRALADFKREFESMGNVVIRDEKWYSLKCVI